MLLQLKAQNNGVKSTVAKLTTYDPVAALVDDEEIAFFMADAFETGDSAYIAKALDVVARAKVVLGAAKVSELPGHPERRNRKQT